MEDTIADDITAITTNPAADYPTRAVMQHFTYAHLQRQDLRDLSRSFAIQALLIYRTCPPNPDRTLALRDLKTSKDNAVCSMLYRI